MQISMVIGTGASLDPNGLARHVQNLESAGVDLVWGVGQAGLAPPNLRPSFPVAS